MVVTDLRALMERALALYKPPFHHVQGFIYDADSNMVADQAAHALRVRGWGQITHVEGVDHEKLQDAVGDLLAEALTAYWLQQGKE